MSFRIPDELNEQRRALLQRVVDDCFDGKKVALARKLGHTDGSFVGQLARGDKPISESIWMALLALPEVKRAGLLPTSPARGVAQVVSLDRAETVPTITMDQLGEQLEMVEPQKLPGVFRMPIENEEMAPRVRPGAWVQFSPALAREARPGDGVLVRDSTGGLHFRVYRAGRAGAWEAHALNENYQTLYSEADGLKVVAVLTAVEGRWT